MRKLRRFLSYAIVLILVTLSEVTVLLALPNKTKSVKAEEIEDGYHLGELEKTYNIVRLDDQPDFSGHTWEYHESTNSRFGLSYCEWCGTCNDQWNDCRHWVTQATSFYGYYDTVYNKWVLTGAYSYGGGDNVIRTQCANPAHSNTNCGETHGMSHSTTRLYYDNHDLYGLNSWIFDAYIRYLGEIGLGCVSLKTIKEIDGHSFEFSSEKGIGGTVSMTYKNQLVPNTYTITFCPNNGENIFIASPIFDTNMYWSVDSQNPTYAGYKFGGWYTGVNGTGEQVYDATGYAVNGAYWSGDGSSAIWKGLSDITLYACWIPDICLVEYNGNGATGGSMSDMNVSYGKSFNPSTCNYTKIGHYFNGWNTSPDGSGSPYIVGTMYTLYPAYNGERLVLYAQWLPSQYSVALNMGTGIASVSGGGTKSYGESVSISAIAKIGYTWSKWTGSAETITNPYSFSMSDSAMTFTANATPNNYTVTFDAKGGTTNLSTLTVTYDSTSCNNIASYSTTKPGYEFNGWKDEYGNPIWDKNGECISGNYWNGSKQWKYAGNVKAYADWIDRIPPTVKVLPEDSGGVWVTAKDITIYAADNEALSGSNAYQYCLSTNSSSPTGSWVNYKNGQSFTIGGGLTGEYYLWVKAVTDEKGNSSSSTGYHKFGPYYFDNTAPDLSKVSLTYGWYAEGTTINFDISDYNAGISSIALNDFNGIRVADITTSKSYRFDTSGANFYYIVATDVLGNISVKAFMVKIDKTGEVIRDNAVWKGLNDLKVFAIWLANKYTVKFDKNDNDGGSTRATGVMADIVLTYDKTTKLPANGYTRVGYDFTGWNRSSDGTGDPFPDEASVKNLTVNANEVVTLYAQWNASAYTLTFDYNKPSNSTGTLKGGTETSRAVYYDSQIGRLPEPTISGWAFDGWYIGDEEITADTVWRYTSDQVAVAKWTSVKYEVRLHSSQPEYALSSITRVTPVGWTWNSAGYYSTVFTYDVESTLPVPSSVYSLREYTVKGWYGNSLCTTYVGNGTKAWNLTSVNGGVVDLYPAWRDSTGPRITVTPERTINAYADNNAVRNINVTIKIEELGSGLSADNKYEYGFTTSSTSTPVTWEKYSSTTGATGFTVTLPELGKSKNGYYYLWVKQISDRSGNLSTSTMEVSNTRACHVYGIYVFDNAAPTGTVKYVENNAMLGLYGTSAIDNPYAVMTVEDAADAIAGVEELKLVIADFDNASNKAEFEFVKESGVYKCSFNLYDCLVNPSEVEQVSMKVIAVDKVGNTGILPVTSYDFGRKQDGTPIRDRDIGFAEVVDDSTDNDNDGEDNDSDDNKYFIRDAFRVEAAIHDIMGDTQFAKGQLGMVDIYTFGEVETLAVDFGSLNNYVNKLNGVHLPEYQWDATIDLATTVVNHGKTGFYTHEFYVPLYAAESTYTDTVVTGTKGSTPVAQSISGIK